MTMHVLICNGEVLETGLSYRAARREAMVAVALFGPVTVVNVQTKQVIRFVL